MDATAKHKNQGNKKEKQYLHRRNNCNTDAESNTANLANSNEPNESNYKRSAGLPPRTKANRTQHTLPKPTKKTQLKPTFTTRNYVHLKSTQIKPTFTSIHYYQSNVPYATANGHRMGPKYAITHP